MRHTFVRSLGAVQLRTASVVLDEIRAIRADDVRLLCSGGGGGGQRARASLLGEDVCAVIGDEDCVFELGGPGVVEAERRPPVVLDPDQDSALAQDRLCDKRRRYTQRTLDIAQSRWLPLTT